MHQFLSLQSALFLDCGKKPVYPEKTHGEAHAISTQKGHQSNQNSYQGPSCFDDGPWSDWSDGPWSGPTWPEHGIIRSVNMPNCNIQYLFLFIVIVFFY